MFNVARVDRRRPLVAGLAPGEEKNNMRDPLVEGLIKLKEWWHCQNHHPTERRLLWEALRGLQQAGFVNLQGLRPVLGFGPPLTITKEGKTMAYQLPSDQIALFPLKVNGAAPAAGDTFTVVSNNTDQFTAEIGVMPAEAAADAGNPAVKVTCLKHDGMAGVSFTVTDSKGDTAATETFDIVAPVAPPPPAGVISVDEAGIAVSANPNPPTA